METKTVITDEQFNALPRRNEWTGRTSEAAREVLVGGKSKRRAAIDNGISRTAVQLKVAHILKLLERQRPQPQG